MKDITIHLRVSKTTLDQIKELQDLYNQKTYSKTIDFIVNAYYLEHTKKGKDTLKESLDLLKAFEKGINDLSKKITQ